MPQRVQIIRSSVKQQRPTAGTREPGETWVNFADLQFGVINAAKAAQDLIAVRFFSAATNYAEGDFVIQAGRGYRAKGPIVSGPFNAADWDTLTISGEFEPPIAAGTTADYWRGDKSWQILNKAAVGLSNVDNTSDANKPVSSAQQTALNLKANLASPTFTGTPAAPTPAYPNSGTSIATTAFVSANFAPVMDPFLGGNPQATTPPTSDNDTSIATTAYVQANLINYAPIASPTFTGDPRAPTPLQGDNDTSLATTAFVTTAIANKIADAPNDTNAYGRKANAWVDVTEEAPADGVSYGRKNGNWVASVGGAVVSDAPPGPPLIPGQLWYEADSGNTYVWYVDSDLSSSQWVQINVQPAPAAVPAVVGTAQARNRIVNGAMQISQENGTTAGTTNAYYPVDQWSSNFVSSSTITAVRGVGAVNPNGAITMVAAPAETAAAAAEYAMFVTLLEGNKLVDFFWGTVSAKQAVLAFDVNAAVAGTYWVSLANSGNTHTWLGSYSIGAGEVGTWVRKPIVISGVNAGTWLTDNGVGARLRFCFHCGTTFTGVAGFQSGTFYAGPGQALGLSTAGSCGITNVGLYLDPANTGKAPDWTMPDEAEELRACQRYFYTDTAINFAGIRYGAASQAAAEAGLVCLPVAMRIASPAVTPIGAVTATNCSAPVFVSSNSQVIQRVTVTASGGYRNTYPSINISARM